ncbi:MFS transporter [Leifsonia shinshuensis]|uniref:MFS family permease n=1 Tax=Leifsonia shinshuensis TaxID=150026 RepID=A0A853CYP5_9MICO|nr:MFS family permease [Leifsonia shinshuensis]
MRDRTGVLMADAQRRPETRLLFAFVSAVVALIAAFAAVGSTIPLFNIYRAQDHFTNGAIALTVVAYSVGTIGTLLVLGRLSNYVGRRAAAVTALAVLVAGCVVLLNVHAIGVLVAGRLLMGLGAGMASSSLAAYIVDTAPKRPAWLASVASSQTVMLGLAVGAIGSGALVQFAPWPRQLAYLVAIALLVMSAVLIVLSPETVTKASFVWSSLRPSVRVPPQVRPLLPVAAAVILPTWATGAFYQAFVPALVEDQLHTKSPLILGLVFAAYMAPSVFGAPVGHRFKPATAQRIGMAAFLLGWAGLITANATGALPLFLVATIVAGVGQGIAISAVTHGLVSGSNITERAAIFTVIFLLSYTGATIPSLIAGKLSAVVSVPQIAVGYAVLALIGTAYTTAFAKNPVAELVSVSKGSRYA